MIQKPGSALLESMLGLMTMREGQDDTAAAALRALHGMHGMCMISRVAWKLLAGHDSRVA